MNIPTPQLFLSLTTFIVAFKSSPFHLHFPTTFSLYFFVSDNSASLPSVPCKTSLQTSTSLTPSCPSVTPISKHVTIMICDLQRLTHCSSSSVTCSSASRYSCDSLSRSGSTSTVRQKKLVREKGHCKTLFYHK